MVQAGTSRFCPLQRRRMGRTVSTLVNVDHLQVVTCGGLRDQLTQLIQLIAYLYAFIFIIFTSYFFKTYLGKIS